MLRVNDKPNLGKPLVDPGLMIMPRPAPMTHQLSVLRETGQTHDHDRPWAAAAADWAAIVTRAVTQLPPSRFDLWSGPIEDGQGAGSKQ
ncbi:hypothetical protein J6590_003326 [Homalodisca vitripennis]|nr:hypothetical protein J6590_003326 [Homalodisca vitripennis]